MNLKPAEPLDVAPIDGRFDYSSVPSSVGKFLRGQADRIRQQHVNSIIQIGRALLEAKRHLSHGAFLRWVEWEVGMPTRTAQAYMRVASWASNKSATVARLSPSALYLLSASGTPEKFVNGVIARAEAGEYIAPSVMRKELKALRERSAHSVAPMLQPTCIQDLSPFQTPAIYQEPNARLTEFVTILFDRLSPSDFGRVRDIVISDAVLHDPELPKKIGRVFEATVQVNVAQV